MIERVFRSPTSTRIGLGRSAISRTSAARMSGSRRMPSSWSLSWFWSRFHALSEAARGAAADLVQPRLDQSDLTIVIQIELERGQG
jgi:hypothetical protein